MSSVTRFILETVALTIAAVALTCCRPSTPENAQADPGATGAEASSGDSSRLESADAALAAFNQAALRHPSDRAACADLIFAENDVQEKLLAWVRASVAQSELTAELYRRFGEDPDAGMMVGLIGDRPAPIQRAAIITKRDDRRVVAEYLDADGDPTPLHLVEVEDQWWISGYTLEHSEDLGRIADDIDNAVLIEEINSIVFPELTARLRDGEAIVFRSFLGSLTARMLREQRRDPGQWSRVRAFSLNNRSYFANPPKFP